MPPKIHRYWRDRVLSLKEEHPDWGALRIAAALGNEKPPEELPEEYFADGPIGEPGSDRWVGGILRNVWSKLTKEQRENYRLVHWPDTFKKGVLPWEASPAALELLAWSDRYGLPRPPVALARWYWWVTQALPHATAGVRLVVAVTVASHQEADRPLPDGLEWWLAYQTLPREQRRTYDWVSEKPQWERRMSVAPGGPSAFWAIRLIVKHAARSAIYEGEGELS